MFVLRVIVGLEFLSCVTLFLFKKFGSEQINDLAFLDWLYMFAYPVAYIALIFMVVLLPIDVYRFKKNKNKKCLVLIMFDFSLPVLSYMLFEQYYSLIGQM